MRRPAVSQVVRARLRSLFRFGRDPVAARVAGILVLIVLRLRFRKATAGFGSSCGSWGPLNVGCGLTG